MRRLLKISHDVTHAIFHAPVMGWGRERGSLGVLSLLRSVLLWVLIRLKKVCGSSYHVTRELVGLPWFDGREEDCCGGQSGGYEGKLKHWWTQKLHTAIDSKYLAALESSCISSGWISSRAHSIPGRDYRSYLHNLANALTSRMRNTMGTCTEQNRQLCQAGCSQEENLYHIVQQCECSHDARVGCHDHFGAAVQRRLAERMTYVRRELVFATDAGKSSPLEWKDLCNQILRLFGAKELVVAPLTVSWMDVRTNSSAVFHEKLSGKGFSFTDLYRELFGTLFCWRAFGRSTNAPRWPWGCGGIVVRLLASHLGVPDDVASPYSPQFILIGSQDIVVESGSNPSIPLDKGFNRSFLDFRMWESFRTMPLVGRFSRGSPVSPAISFPRCSILNSITLSSSQYCDSERHTNLYTQFTHSRKSGVLQRAEHKFLGTAGAEQPFNFRASESSLRENIFAKKQVALLISPIQALLELLLSLTGIFSPELLEEYLRNVFAEEGLGEGIGHGCYLQSIPAFTWRDFGKPRKTEISMAGPEIEPGSSRMRVHRSEKQERGRTRPNLQQGDIFSGFVSSEISENQGKPKSECLDRQLNPVAPDGEPGSIPGGVAPEFSQPLHSGAAPYSPRFTFIGSQDLDFKSRCNLSAHPSLTLNSSRRELGHDLGFGYNAAMLDSGIPTLSFWSCSCHLGFRHVRWPLGLPYLQPVLCHLVPPIRTQNTICNRAGSNCRTLDRQAYALDHSAIATCTGTRVYKFPVYHLRPDSKLPCATSELISQAKEECYVKFGVISQLYIHSEVNESYFMYSSSNGYASNSGDSSFSDATEGTSDSISSVYTSSSSNLMSFSSPKLVETAGYRLVSLFPSILESQFVTFRE
ncbi:hypothetical protein PR048_007286 [Dryococelus australis]|uniref:Uncharacterized protein n=1 Tax=Dryococelus australis TaxID=614101 RepID=A0ABQ9IDS1_9NEOP|nr:hypothetical protein PR048_007286 [Dryococelus australis]